MSTTSRAASKPGPGMSIRASRDIRSQGARAEKMRNSGILPDLWRGHSVRVHLRRLSRCLGKSSISNQQGPSVRNQDLAQRSQRMNLVSSFGVLCDLCARRLLRPVSEKVGWNRMLRRVSHPAHTWSAYRVICQRRAQSFRTRDVVPLLQQPALVHQTRKPRSLPKPVSYPTAKRLSRRNPRPRKCRGVDSG